MDLILSIFLLVLFTEAVSWIGSSVLLDLTYAGYTRVFMGPKVARQRALKADVLRTKKELQQTSAQDQFAKWAKLRRSVDKGLADLEKLNGEISSARTAYALKFKSALWAATTGAQFALGWWYRSTPVFFLPPGWLGPAAWWLALPFAPRGAVSCGVWQMACRRVIKVGERVVRSVLVPAPVLAEPMAAQTEKGGAAPADSKSRS